MVKLEWCDGGSVFVRADLVASINPTYDEGACLTLSGCGDREKLVYVKGTPDEVHAKLFPPVAGFGFSDTERNEAMLKVLEWVADENVPANASPSAHLVTLARKALGMEET